MNRIGPQQRAAHWNINRSKVFCGLCEGMNKIIINHIDKLFVTSDCGTIINELDVFHPAAKLVAMAAKSQQQEIGDGTNSVGSDGSSWL